MSVNCKFAIKVKQSTTGKVTSYMQPQEDYQTFRNQIDNLISKGFEVYNTKCIYNTQFVYMKLKKE